MQARYYDPVIGRFYSNDPVGTVGHLSQGSIQGFNRYAYANYNPYKCTDPDCKFALPLLLFAPEIIALGKAAFFVGSAALDGYAGSEAINAYNESSESGEVTSDREPGTDGKKGSTGGPGAGKKI